MIRNYFTKSYTYSSFIGVQIHFPPEVYANVYCHYSGREYFFPTHCPLHHRWFSFFIALIIIADSFLRLSLMADPVLLRDIIILDLNNTVRHILMIPILQNKKICLHQIKFYVYGHAVKSEVSIHSPRQRDFKHHIFNQT